MIPRRPAATRPFNAKLRRLHSSWLLPRLSALSSGLRRAPRPCIGRLSVPAINTGVNGLLSRIPRHRLSVRTSSARSGGGSSRAGEAFRLVASGQDSLPEVLTTEPYGRSKRYRAAAFRESRHSAAPHSDLILWRTAQQDNHLNGRFGRALTWARHAGAACFSLIAPGAVARVVVAGSTARGNGQMGRCGRRSYRPLQVWVNL